MAKKISTKKSILLGTICLLLSLFLSGCNEDDSGQVLRILNMEDYIYINEGDEEELPDLVIQFEEYARELGYEDVHVVYDTTDTNETLYSELQTGKSQYDLICPSDYMVQKLIYNNLVTKLDMSKIPNYQKYASKRIKDTFDNIFVDLPNNGGREYVKDYSVGYMWGTLGILFNPEYDGFTVDFDKSIEDMQNWSTLWNADYYSTSSIKDSMRDTYACGIMETYKDELIEFKDKLDNKEITPEEYNQGLTEIFNRCDFDSVKEVEQTLKLLKENVFGLEVDSGKQDIVTGKIGINLAWSGDAVYSMDQAEDEEQVTEPFELYYSVPELGSNIWFDGWVMPNIERTEDQYELAHLFLDFICDPINAAQNMNYTGYTSFIGGDSILELVRDWYDVREDIDYDTGNVDPEWEVVDLTYFFDGTLDEYEDSDMIFYSDCYLPFEDNISVGRQFFCQYPNEETINRCCVMRDYGNNNENVIRMWEEFKSSPLPIWAIILFIIEIVFIISAIVIYFLNSKIKSVLRQKRKEN